MPRHKENPKGHRTGKTGESSHPVASQTGSAELHPALTEIVQEHPEDAPPGWAAVQEKLAASSGLSVLLVDGRQPPALLASNNNSICHAFQSSLEYVSLCDPYCGDAHRRALSAGVTVQYKCHAGLQCFTMPVQIGGGQNLAAIGGRAFVSGGDYRRLVDRFRAGELNDLLPSKPFENVIFAELQKLDQLSVRLQKATRHFGSYAPTLVDQATDVSSAAVTDEDPPDIEVDRDVVDDGGTASDNHRRAIARIDSDSSLLGGSSDKMTDSETFAIGSDPNLQEELQSLRLKMKHSSNLTALLDRLSERLDLPDPGVTYKEVVAVVKELLKAERASVMTFDEAANELVIKASEGLVSGEGEVIKLGLGEGIAERVFESGQACFTEDLEIAGFARAPAERSYKTKSFISFPIITKKGRKLGVLNVADKVGGGQFDAVDLGMLEVIGARIAEAVYRAELQEHSFTDPLTGLFNRRSLNERLTVELNRSQRYSYPMSFLMIDIDDFKRYNDLNGHPAGDGALRTTAHTLKTALRATDVAFRYGGEEFCILLPQTSLVEAGVIAERMRQRVTEADYPHGKSQPLGIVSVSIGISTSGTVIDNAEKVIAAADQALYSAKSQGKNRIEFYSSTS